MEQLNEEVHRLVNGAHKTLNRALDEFNIIQAQESYLNVSAYEQLDNVRRSLAQADHVLSDINSIINSYNVFQLNELNLQAPQGSKEQHAQPSEIPE